MENRIPEYRVWDVEKKRMIFFNAFEEWGAINHILEPNTSLSQGAKKLSLSTNPEKYIWLSAVGIKDYNGKKIFDRDIIEYKIGLGSHARMLRMRVVWYQDGFRVIPVNVQPVTRGRKKNVMPTPHHCNLRDWTYCVVIGNEFVNPELLTKQISQ